VSKDKPKSPVERQPATVDAEPTKSVMLGSEPAESVTPAKRQWNVTFNGETDLIEADTAEEARAIRNDSRKSWPPPRQVKVEPAE
jgi:hypothetical protein